MNINVLDDLLQAELMVERFGQKLFVSVFLIDGMLIDTGPNIKKELLIPLYNEWDVDQVILTHHHEDHTGLASWLQENKNIPIHIHELGVPLCAHKEKLPLYRRLFWGDGESFIPQTLSDTYETENYLWEMIHTPGHAPDHVSIFNREKGWMFGGDLYVQDQPRSAYTFESLPEVIQSLEKMLTYDFDTYICSHDGIIPNGRRVIEKKRNYLVETREEMESLHQQGLSINEIRKIMFPKTHPLYYLSFFENSPKHFIKSMLGKV